MVLPNIHFDPNRRLKRTAVALLLLITLTTSTAQQQQQQQQQQPQAAALLACTNSPPGCSGAHSTWDHLLGDRHSCLVAAWARWSPRPSPLPVTLVTQLSLNRLPQLRAQCQAWPGPLAAAVYLPLLNPEPQLQDHALRKIRAAKSDLEDLFLQSEAGGNASSLCQLRLLLVHEAFDQERTAAVLYPVNTLRNLARLMADTQLIANIDVDMLPSASLSASMQAGGQAAGAGGADYVKGCSERNHVYVIPAFETSCGGPAYADAAVKRPKDDLHAMIADNCLSQFREKVAPACHNVTDYARWFRAAEPYAVQYKEEFEPWFISARTQAQWFDYRFRGYGKNKIAQVAATARMSGASFMVHPSGFLVHRQHTESQSRKAFLRVKFKSRKNAEMLSGSLYEHIETLWAQVQAEMANSSYHPRLDPSVEACLKTLPWWKSA